MESMELGFNDGGENRNSYVHQMKDNFVCKLIWCCVL